MRELGEYDSLIRKKNSLLGSIDRMRPRYSFLVDILKDIFTFISILDEVMTVFSRSMQEIHRGNHLEKILEYYLYKLGK